MASKGLGIIGCGQMARALLGGLKNKPELFHKIFVTDVVREKARKMAFEFAVEDLETNRDLVENSDLVVLAVKPNQVFDVLKDVSSALTQEQVVVSLAAGVTLGSMAEEVGRRIPLVRAMPNTPCLVGQGMVALAFGGLVRKEDRLLVVEMFSALGEVEVVPETFMDGVTALSGSGPAYIFLVAEAMIDAGVNIGLSRELAKKLVYQTIFGAAYMLKKSGEHPALLKDQVTSPGGTTIAALRCLEGLGLRTAFFEAINAAWEKSKELGRH